MTGHSTCMYSLVPVCVVRQQSWLVNSSWKPARSSDNVLFWRHLALFIDDRLRWLHILFVSLYLVKNKCYISLFILIYFVVNSYIVNKTLKCTGAQPPEIDQHKMETKGLRKKRQGVSITDIHQRSLHQESL